MPDIFVSDNNPEENKIGQDFPQQRNEAVHGVKPETIHRFKDVDKDKEVIRNSTIISSAPGIFSSFKVRPRGIRFQEQEENEEVLLIFRKHIITNIPWLLFSLVLIIAPLALFSFFNLSELLQNFQVPPRSTMIIILGYYLLIFCYMFVNYITWYYNADLITNRKIVDINFQDIVYHNVSMTQLKLVENVNYVQAGFVPSFFGYGDVFIETAGKALTFRFYAVPHPGRVVSLVESLMEGHHAE